MELIHKHVLGIDASTHTLAFCYMENGIPKWWGEYDLGAGNDLHTRLGQAFERISSIIGNAISDSDSLVCFIESAVRINNIKVTISLAEMYGIIIGSIASQGIKVYEVPPITWQNFIGNKSLTKAEKAAVVKANPGLSKATVNNRMRDMRKQRTINWVKERFSIDIESNNVSDAFGVAWYGTHHRGSRG